MRRARTHLASQGISLGSNQIGYNLLKRYSETNGVLDACRELNVGLIAYTPFILRDLEWQISEQVGPLSGHVQLVFLFKSIRLL
jgi:aryl-alcohol dehydrogenase-like predicted oxidoreductase